MLVGILKCNLKTAKKQNEELTVSLTVFFWGGEGTGRVSSKAKDIRMMAAKVC